MGVAVILGVSDDSLPRFAGVMTAGEGVSPDRVRALVRRGVLVPVGHGAYARAALMARMDPGGQQALRVASVLEAAGSGQYAGSHHSAAVIHGLDLLARQPPALVAVTHPPGSASRTSRPGVRVHAAALPDEHVTVHGGVRVTSVARTVVDLARTSSFRSGVVVADFGAAQQADLQGRTAVGAVGVCPLARHPPGETGGRVQRRPSGIGPRVDLAGRLPRSRTPRARAPGMGGRRRRA